MIKGYPGTKDYLAKGKRYVYFGNVRLRAEPGTSAFDAEYKAASAAMAAQDEADKPRRPKKRQLGPPSPQSLNWLVAEYERSTTFAELDRETQRARHNVLAALCKRTVEGIEIGALPYAGKDGLTPHRVERLRDLKVDHPEAGNKIVKDLRAMFEWAKAKPRELVKVNPCDGVKRRKPLNEDGFYTATAEEVQHLLSFYPLGTVEHRAVALLFYCGVRRSDVVRLGPAMVRPGLDPESGAPIRQMHIAPRKGAKSNHRKKPHLITLTVSAELEIILAAPITTAAHRCVGNVVPLRREGATYLINQWGRPFTKNGFGNAFKGWCTAAGVPHITAHSLRKAGATLMAENGATTTQLMATYGWSKLATAQPYIDKFNRARAAAQGSQYLRLPKAGL